jgi:transcriptional regulator with XRE-family HTH domain
MSVAPRSRSQGARAKDPELVALGGRIRELRMRIGKSQEALGFDADRLHWTYVGQIERGQRNVTYKNLRRLARGLEVDVAELFRTCGSPVAEARASPAPRDR